MKGWLAMFDKVDVSSHSSLPGWPWLWFLVSELHLDLYTHTQKTHTHTQPFIYFLKIPTLICTDMKPCSLILALYRHVDWTSVFLCLEDLSCAKHHGKHFMLYLITYFIWKYYKVGDTFTYNWYCPKRPDCLKSGISNLVLLFPASLPHSLHLKNFCYRVYKRPQQLHLPQATAWVLNRGFFTGFRKALISTLISERMAVCLFFLTFSKWEVATKQSGNVRWGL